MREERSTPMDIEQSLISRFPDTIIGAEDDDTVTDPNGEQNDDHGANGTENDDPEGTEGTKGKSGDGALTALRAERKLKRDAEAEAARLRRENEELKRKDLDELELAKAERDAASKASTESQEKLARLAAGMKRTALESAIRAEAEKLKFVDTSDAIAGVDITGIEIDQDEDDPSDIVIDTKAVAKAVKALATAKPHYLRAGTSDGHPSGSTFGGSRGNKGEQDQEAALRSRYPSL